MDRLFGGVAAFAVLVFIAVLAWTGQNVADPGFRTFITCTGIIVELICFISLLIFIDNR